MTRTVLPVMFAAALAVAIASPAVAQDSRIVVSVEDCKRLVRHYPSADVEYKPGVDVRGRKVAPADLPGSKPLKLSDSFEFDITLEVFERLGIEAPKGLEDTALTVGTVSVDRRGNVLFNGEPLDDEEEAAIAEACQELMAQRKRR